MCNTVFAKASNRSCNNNYGILLWKCGYCLYLMIHLHWLVFLVDTACLRYMIPDDVKWMQLSKIEDNIIITLS